MVMDEKVFKNRAGVSEIEGYVVERRTTGRRRA